MPTSFIVITKSDFRAVDLFIFSSTNKQMILINYCSIYGAGGVGLAVYASHFIQHSLPQIFIVNTQLFDSTTNINNFGNIIFTNVSITNSSDTGLLVINSKLTIKGSFTLINNRGHDGGGLSLYGSSQLEIYPNSNLTFIGNHAIKGGGI